MKDQTQFRQLTTLRGLPLISVIPIFLFIASGLHGQQFRFSEGLYRVPYANGNNVNMGSDVWTHNPVGKYDMWADNANQLIVAAADGWIRGIQESFDTACFVVINGQVQCCWQLNNYVIMQHPNGEWSGYTHVAVNSVSGQGIVLNQFVTAGTPIGVEGSVGCSSGRHLHWEVSRPADQSNGFQPIGGFLNGELFIPVICGIGTEQPWFVQNGDYLAGPCDDDCATDFITDTDVGNGGEYVARADNSILTDDSADVELSNGSVVQYRAGDFIRMLPGFAAEVGARFEALVKGCNTQE